MSRRASKIVVNADAPLWGPFREAAPVDAVGASAVLLLTAMLVGMSLIALLAIFDRVAS